VDLAVCLAYGLDGSRRLKPLMGGCGIGYVTVNLLMAMIRNQTKLLKTVNCGNNADAYSFVDVAGVQALVSKTLMDQLSSREASRFPLGFKNVSGNYLT